MTTSFIRLLAAALTTCAIISSQGREARADQCEIINQQQAAAAQQFLRTSRQVAFLCEPCGERLGAGTRVVSISSVEMVPRDPGAAQWSLLVDGRQIDLAYTFTSTDGVRFENLAQSAGCPASDVSLSFIVGSPPPPSQQPSFHVGGTVGSAAQVRPASTWRRPVGPVRFALTSVFVAPGKSTGLPWDGPGQLPTATRQGLQAGVTVQAARAIFSAFIDAGTSMAAARLAPWAINTMSSATAAPDVRVDVLLDGRQVGRVQTRTHSFTPSWTGATNTTYQVGPNQQIDISAWDTDLMFDDHIGVCTIQGMPLVDRNGYARAEDFTCNGQLWGVRLRILADSYEAVADGDVAVAPPPSAVQVTPPAIPQQEPAETTRRGGVGESCTRTDDCNAPLRCIRHECMTPTE
jgi:hypothetical protein